MSLSDKILCVYFLFRKFPRVLIQGLNELTKTSVNMVCFRTEVGPGNAGIHSESAIYPTAVLGSKTETI